MRWHRQLEYLINSHRAIPWFWLQVPDRRLDSSSLFLFIVNDGVGTYPLRRNNDSIADLKRTG